MIIAIYDDHSQNLHPLTLTRPIYMLRCGPSLLYEKIIQRLNLDGRIVFFMREYLAEAYAEKLSRKAGGKVFVNELKLLKSGEDLFIVYGGWLPPKGPLELEEDTIAVKDDRIIYAHVKSSSISGIADRCDNLRELLDALRSELSEVRLDDARLIENLWDLIEYNEGEIVLEAERFKRMENYRRIDEGVGVYVVGDREDIIVARGVEIYPQTVFDSSKGPIVIDEDARIMPFSYIAGPCYVGRGSWIVGGKISGSTIGPVCRIGGEVEESIIQGFSNKYHEGFLGHSYVGEWVNLAALTTVSDLKNDYSSIGVPVGGRLVDSGRLKLGAFIGDHTRTGIGSLLTAGSVIGVMCNLVTSGEPCPKYIPSFTWYVKGRVRDWIPVDRMIDAARRMMARRGVRLTDAEERLYRRLYEETREERRRFRENLLRGIW